MTLVKTRVLVVEDSVTIRKHIVGILEAEAEFDVIGEAADGKSAIELCQRLKPDVVTMDMMLPVMTGVAATEYIMAYCPTPILIVSASMNRGELFRTYDALAAGAVDVLDKPGRVEADQAWERRLVAAVRMVAKIRVISHPRARQGLFTPPRSGDQTAGRPPPPPVLAEQPRVLAIGASTGGPGALVNLLGSLPLDFPLPVLVVLHISSMFAQAIAEWLDGQIGLPVRYAKEGEPLPQVGHSCVLMAPPDLHLVLSAGKLELSGAPPRHSCRPSVDVLFDSVAQELGRRSIACLLTGMGRDGARGLLAIHQAGGMTVAQDEASSVVFGMPHEAIKLGAASQILPLGEIGGAVVRAVQNSRKG